MQLKITCETTSRLSARLNVVKELVKGIFQYCLNKGRGLLVALVTVRSCALITMDAFLCSSHFLTDQIY